MKRLLVALSLLIERPRPKRRPAREQLAPRLPPKVPRPTRRDRKACPACRHPGRRSATQVPEGLSASKRTVSKGLRDYRSVRLRTRELRKSLGDIMRVTPLVKTERFVLDRIDLRAKQPAGAARSTKPKVLTVGGVHAGSEPVGVEAALRFAEGLVKDPSILEHFDITVVPLVNPSGFMRTVETKSKNGTPGRYTTRGVDINRSFGEGLWTAESRAMADLMLGERFHVVLDMHGAGPQRDGFFAIRGGNDGGAGVASRIMRDADGVPLLSARSAGKSYSYDTPGVVTSANPGTLKHFAISTGARYGYTFEAPARFTGEQQVKGSLSMVHSALRNLAAHGEF